MRAALLLMLALALPGHAFAEGAKAPAYRVIVNVERKANSVDKKRLADIFLKKVTSWDGQAARPVDLPSDSSLRARFSDDVLRTTVSAVKNYWQQQIFSGRNVPPPELDDDAQVIRYVQSHPGAVGYVSLKADVSGVKVIAVE